MTEASPNWKEHEGEILPSYTGPNAPVYPNDSQAENLQQLGETHPEFQPSDAEEVDVDQTGVTEELSPEAAAEQARQQIRDFINTTRQEQTEREGGPLPPVNHYGATIKYTEGRKPKE
jgi:hypothetical protein